MTTIIRQAKTRGGLYLKVLEKREDGLCDIKDYKHGILRGTCCNRYEGDAQLLFNNQIADAKRFDNINYIEF